MLVALNKLGKTVNLIQYSKQEIDLFKEEKWFCPSCKQKVILKNGSIKQAHFAHKVQENCCVFSESESIQHLNGKKRIANWCEQYDVSYELEAYLPEIAQRPDVLIDGKWAIEFQCSSLSLERLRERTEMYKKYRYEVLWLLGEQFYIDGKSSLSQLQKYFLGYHHQIGFYLWELCSKEQKISLCALIEENILEKSLEYVRISWFFDRHSPLDWLNYLSKTQLFLGRQYESYGLVKKKYQAIERALYYQDKKILNLQNELYTQNQHLLYLADIFYCVLPAMYFLKDEVIYWYRYWWKKVLDSVERNFSIESFVEFFQILLDKGCLDIHRLPQISVRQCLLYFLSQYHLILEQKNYIQINHQEETIKILKYPKEITWRTEEIQKELHSWKAIRQISAPFL